MMQLAWGSDLPQLSSSEHACGDWAQILSCSWWGAFDQFACTLLDFPYALLISSIEILLYIKSSGSSHFTIQLRSLVTMASYSGLRAISLLLVVLLVCQICLVQPTLARQLMKEKSTVPADHEANSEKPKSTPEHGGHGYGNGWGHGNGKDHGKDHGKGRGNGRGGHH